METRSKSTKVILIVLALGGLVAFSVIGYAGDLEPSAPPGSTMKTLDEVEPRIAIGVNTTPGDANNLYKITSPGSYYLTSNVTINFKHAILIDSDDVTVDLSGYRLRSSWLNVTGDINFDGIHIAQGRGNIEIRNGTISSNRSVKGLYSYRGFRSGITTGETAMGNGITVVNMRVTGSRESGIYVAGDGNCKVSSCVVAENDTYGIYVSFRF